jgi:hypothetical protein
MKNARNFVLIASAALTVAACDQVPNNSNQVYYAQQDTAICVDQNTGQRIPDAQCNPYSTYHHSHWYYLPRKQPIPYYGQRAAFGSYQKIPGHIFSPAPIRLARPLPITPVDHGVTKQVTVIKTTVTEKPKGFFARFKPSSRTTTTTTTRVTRSSSGGFHSSSSHSSSHH